MNRPQLEHIIRAAAGITGADRFVIIGSQAILGQHPDPPPETVISVEVDVFTLRSPEDAELIDGSIGEASPFHQTFGYYAHGVGEETAVLPDGWKDRLVPFQTPSTGGATGLCLEAHDLAAAKLAAGREKDLAYVGALVRHGVVSEELVGERLTSMPFSREQLDVCRLRLRRAVGRGT